MTSTPAKGFVCEEYVETLNGIVEPDKELSFYDKVEFLLHGDRLNVSGENEAAVRARK